MSGVSPVIRFESDEAKKTAAGAISTFSLTTFSLSSYFSASDSTVGASILQGGHHAAQKSTSTGWDDFKTSLSKFVSLTSVTYSLIDLSFHIMIIILRP